MLIRLITITAVSLGAMACASAHPVQQTGWRLNPALCPDLKEDRRDRAVTKGPRDLREDRRDARYITCPARAWTYIGPDGSKTKVLAPVYKTIYVDRHGHYYGVQNGKTIRIVTIR